MSALLTLSRSVCQEPDLLELASQACVAVTALLPSVRWASATTHFDGHPVTVAATDLRALMLDHAQYREGEGPALEAMRTGGRVVMTSTNGRLYWAGVRLVADTLGVHGISAAPL